jgi:asparagine synthase (glutamine-hydrolysing)
VSGIAGIFNADGEAIDFSLLQRMTESTGYWGADSHVTRNYGAAGFGHALLKTTDESEHENQPLTLDGHVWVVADARIDGRDALVRELSACTHVAIRDPQDVELIAYADSVWGEDCVKHLLGDFAFVIWDSPKKLVFCARDHMGVKPFYYAQHGSSLVFSNSLEAIRLHPCVSTRLNDDAIADFLLFGLNHDQAKTTFADIDRLPPAHTLTY